MRNTSNQDSLSRLNLFLETGDPQFKEELSALLKTTNIKAMASKIGVSRTALYTSFKPERKPSLWLIQKVLGELGYKLQIVPKQDN